jgi:AraC family transcriptional regulator, positive regulator of tynA and feaB
MAHKLTSGPGVTGCPLTDPSMTTAILHLDIALCRGVLHGKIDLEPLLRCVLRCAPTASAVCAAGGPSDMGAWGTQMSQLFSTDLLPAADRIDAWQWKAQQICGDCRIRLPKSSFHGSIEVRHVGDLPLTRFSSSPLSFWKWPFDSVNAENRSCIVITQIAGVRRYLQNGADLLLKPGDSTLIDSGSPWSSSCRSDCIRLYLRVPRWMLENRLRTHEIPVAQKICGKGGMGAALHRMSLALFDEAEWMKEGQGATALDAYFEILAACVGGDDPPIQGGSELSGRILRFIDSHISEPTLGPAEVASAMGISVRHVHRLFSVTGNTLGDHIRVRRLERCLNDLLNPRFRKKTITEIAFFWGFSDAAHFSHSFKKQFGVSPRAFRAQTITRGQHSSPDGRARVFLHSEASEFPHSSTN